MTKLLTSTALLIFLLQTGCNLLPLYTDNRTDITDDPEWQGELQGVQVLVLQRDVFLKKNSIFGSVKLLMREQKTQSVSATEYFRRVSEDQIEMYNYDSELNMLPEGTDLEVVSIYRISGISPDYELNVKILDGDFQGHVVRASGGMIGGYPGDKGSLKLDPKFLAPAASE